MTTTETRDHDLTRPKIRKRRRPEQQLNLEYVTRRYQIDDGTIRVIDPTVCPRFQAWKKGLNGGWTGPTYCHTVNQFHDQPRDRPACRCNPEGDTP